MVVVGSKMKGVKKVDTHPWKEEEEEEEDEDPGLPYQNHYHQSWSSSSSFPPNHPLHHQLMVVVVVSVEVVVVVLTEIPCLRTRRRVRATFCECYGILPFCSLGTLPVEVRLSCSNVSVPVNLRIFLAYFPPFWRRIREDIGNRSGACVFRACYTGHGPIHRSCEWRSNEIFLPRRDLRCRADLRDGHEFLGLCVEGKCTPHDLSSQLQQRKNWYQSRESCWQQQHRCCCCWWLGCRFGLRQRKRLRFLGRVYDETIHRPGRHRHCLLRPVRCL